jgi:hypothetical protein
MAKIEWSNPFHTAKIKDIKPGDKMFKINNGFMTCDRASIYVDPKCPSHIANVLMQAYDAGWIKPVAHCTEKEYMLMGLNHGDL